jgi:hypothetical protein
MDNFEEIVVRRLKCPQCNTELLLTYGVDEKIIPFRSLDTSFPVSIVVIETRNYACNCGITVKLPKIKHYIPEEK